MKNAREMFEELGYKQEPIKGTVIIYRKYADAIKFFNKRQVFSTYYREYPVNVLKAIMKQCNELGWFDD